MSHHELAYPKKVQIDDITVRDGFQHEEIWITTDAKLWYLEELILCGIKDLEVTNFGNPALMPQFKDADELFKRLRGSKKLSRAGVNWNDCTLTAITIRERSVDRAIAAKREGWGPDRILRSESILNRRIPKQPRDEFKRQGLPALKKKLGEDPGLKYPKDWPEKSTYKYQGKGKQG